MVESIVRVLIVDDDEDIRLLTRIRLESAGLSVVGEARHADCGVKLACRHQPDVILLDERMPGRCGSESIPDLREVAPHARILMYTAFLEDSVGGVANADGYLEKTAPLAEVLRACR